MKAITTRITALVSQCETMFGRLETIPLSAADKLIALLERAPDEALTIIVERRIKFCWPIAVRVLDGRKKAAK